MNNKNIVFQEEYKRLDALCKDIFTSREGVSEYIRQMELVSYADRRYYIDWDADYKQLKHLRWVRNQLAHEVGTLDEDFCTDIEIEWLQNFYQRILRVSDPLSVIRKGKQEVEQKNEQCWVYSEKQNSQGNVAQRNKKQESGWSKFIAKIKKFFSK